MNSDLDEKASVDMDENGDAPVTKRAKRILSETSDSSPCKASTASSSSKNITDDADYVAREMLTIERMKLEIERKKLETMTNIASDFKRLTNFVRDFVDEDANCRSNGEKTALLRGLEIPGHENVGI